MCGIAGLFHSQKGPIDRDILSRMNDIQYHRGPDEGGLHIEEGVGLAHRRLSIIDLAGGQQPLFNDDRSVVIVYNGEVYNFKELHKELAAKGYCFHTHSDTEAILHAWEAWGPDCVARLRGMFAFAIWDRNRQTLFLARDRLGIKPLHYALLPDGQFLFGSELKALTVHPGLSREIEPTAVEDYFTFGYVPDPKTIYKQAHKLPPGHTLSLRFGQGSPEIRQYWDVPFADEIENTPGADLAGQLTANLRDAVDIRLVSEVPLGAFLSGGVDSSSVVAMMAGLQSDPVNTCAIAFKEKQFNEAHYARSVAEQYHTRHYEETVDPDDFSLVDKLAGLYDEPYADSSAMPTYRVCELARKHVTVALSGDGGDEVFAGYRRYRWHMNEEQVRSRLPLALRKPLFGFLGRAYPKADWAPRVFRAKSTFQSLARDSVEAYLHSVSIHDDAQRSQLFSHDFKQSLDGYQAIEVFRHHQQRCQSHDPLTLVQYLDMKTYMVGDILTKVDRASMAHSLEVRVPLLDHKLIEWSCRLPATVKLQGQETKYILKKAMEPHLHKDILYRRKMGFAVPLAKWFRGPLQDKITDAVTGRLMHDSGYFNPGYLQTLLQQHQSGRRDHSASLWTLMMFNAFLQKSQA